MGLHPQRREMVDVELVDVEPSDADLAALATVAGQGSATPVRRVWWADPSIDRDRPHAPRFSRRLGIVASATVLAVTLAVATQESPRVDGLVGGAPSLISPLAERWRVQAPSGWSVGAGLLLTTTHGPQGPLVTAFDLVSGAQRWTLTPSAGTSGIRCPLEVAGADGPWVVCRAVGHVAQMHHLAEGARDDPGRLLMVSAADGTVVSERPLPAGHVALGEIGGDLVTADLTLADPARDGPDAEMTLHLERHDLELDVSVWSTDLQVGGYTAPAAVKVAVEHGVVLVTGRTTAVLDGTDGESIAVWRGSGDRRDTTAGQVTVSPEGFSVRGPRARWSSPTAWFALDGTPLGSFVGDIAEPAVRDGSEPGITLVVTPGHTSLRGVDVPSGRALWSVDLEGGKPVVRVGGAVVISGSKALRAIDLRSGVELWRSSADALDAGQAVSDGRFVLATGSGPGTGPSISAVSLTDGSLLWRTDLPPGARVLTVLDGHLVATGPGVVIGLG